MKHINNFNEFLNESKKTDELGIQFGESLIELFKKYGLDTYDVETTKISDRLYAAAGYRNQLKSGKYPTRWVWRNMNWEGKKELKSRFPAQKLEELFSKIPKSILVKLKKVLTKLFTDYVKKYLTDDNIEKSIKFELEYTNKDDDTKSILSLNDWPKTLKKFFNFVKKNDILPSYGFNPKELNVTTEYKNSKTGSVANSSFSTYYYYDIIINYRGKTFKFNDVLLNSSYYSGGWN